jgi:hypothetical protein
MLPIKYNQNTIDGIIYVLETFRICKGLKLNVENPQENSPNHEKWTSVINKTMNETRERSKVCNSIIREIHTFLLMFFMFLFLLL